MDVFVTAEIGFLPRKTALSSLFRQAFNSELLKPVIALLGAETL
ncbi:hypothetical protein HBNXNv_0722 [Candidatus Nanohalovita haloferacivicina]|nr:hypothetical protein HBNXNv_0722 [Candidatus Nanohalobia archaeon BNXNv]